jgi:hypothetical protein
MTTPTQAVKKPVVSGGIEPRWTKPRVTRWLEIGAVPAILGLWWPDWLGSYAGVPAVPASLPAFPPVLSYVGAVILLIACYQGVKDMGVHFRGVVVAGGIALGAAAASIVAVLFGWNAVSLFTVGVAGLSSAGFFWFTIGKVADITQERRIRATWIAVAALTLLTAIVYLSGLSVFVAQGAAAGLPILRWGVALLTATFLLCRYAVYCYRTQTSIGAVFRRDPEEQFWGAGVR